MPISYCNIKVFYYYIIGIYHQHACYRQKVDELEAESTINGLYKY